MVVEGPRLSLIEAQASASSSPEPAQGSGSGSFPAALVSLGTGLVEALPLQKVTLPGLREAIKDHFALDMASDFRVTVDPEGITEVPSDEQLYLHIRAQQVLHVNIGRGAVMQLEQHIGRLRQFHTSAVQRDLGLLRMAVDRLTGQMRQVQKDSQVSLGTREALEVRLSDHEGLCRGEMVRTEGLLRQIHRDVQREQQAREALEVRLADHDGHIHKLISDVQQEQRSKEVLATRLAEHEGKMEAEVQRAQQLRQVGDEELQKQVEEVQRALESSLASLRHEVERQVATPRLDVKPDSSFKHRLEVCEKHLATLSERNAQIQTELRGVEREAAKAKAEEPEPLQESRLQAGAVAVICKLEQEPDLNGQVVRLHEFSDAKQRWEVYLSQGTSGARRLYLKPENLEPYGGGEPEVIERPRVTSVAGTPSGNVSHSAGHRVGVMLAPTPLPAEATIDKVMYRGTPARSSDSPPPVAHVQTRRLSASATSPERRRLSLSPRISQACRPSGGSAAETVVVGSPRAGGMPVRAAASSASGWHSPAASMTAPQHSLRRQASDGALWGGASARARATGEGRVYVSVHTGADAEQVAAGAQQAIHHALAQGRIGSCVGPTAVPAISGSPALPERPRTDWNSPPSWGSRWMERIERDPVNASSFSSRNLVPRGGSPAAPKPPHGLARPAGPW